MRQCKEHDDLGCPMTRINRVDGQGPVPCDIMLIGEAPGKTEDRKGTPFCGKSGSELTHLYLGKCANIDRRNVYVTNLVKCLKGATLVYMPDGNSKRISSIVSHTWDTHVMSYDPVINQFVPKRIIGRHRSKLNGRKWFKVYHIYSKDNPKGTAGAVVTNDHEFLAKDGNWVRADELTGTEINTGTCGLSLFGEAVAVGTLLGDATIPRDSAHITLTHSAKQNEWLMYKSMALGIKDWRFYDAYEVNGHSVVRNRTKASGYISHLRSRFYETIPYVKKRRKKANNDIIGRVFKGRYGELALATWFIDDGYTKLVGGNTKGSEIASCAFSYSECEYLSHLLKDVFGLDNKVTHRGGNNRIVFGAEMSRKLCSIIAKYTPEQVRYKLWNASMLDKFGEDTWLGESRKVLVPFYSHAFGEQCNHKDTTTYCLSVEDTENFITPAGVVHNCRTNEKDRNPSVAEIDACMMLLSQEAIKVNPRFVGAVGSIATRHVLSAGMQMEKVHGFGYPSPENDCLIMPLYHPAFGLHNTAMMRHIMEDWTRFGRLIRGDTHVMWKERS